MPVSEGSSSCPNVATIKYENTELRSVEHKRRIRRRPLYRDKTVSSFDSNRSSTETPSDSMPTDGGGGGEPPVKTRSRRRLWDSFLHKTRKIRLRSRSRDKGGGGALDKRASSQPNIPSARTGGASDTEERLHNQSASVPSANGKDSAAGNKDAKLGRLRSWQRRRKGKNHQSVWSSSSLNDSAFESSSPVDKGSSPEFEGDVNDYEDNDYCILKGRTTSAKRTLSDPTLLPDSLRDSLDYSPDTDVDKLEFPKDRDGDGVPIIEQDSPQVSKSVDSLLAVASSISLPPKAVLRSNPRSDRHSLQPYSCLADFSSGAGAANGQIRRHSYDVRPSDMSEDAEFFDCCDVLSEGDVTSSSSEQSPVRRLRGMREEPLPSEGWDRLRCRRVTVSSTNQSTSLGSDKDSIDSDKEERATCDLDVGGAISVCSEDHLPGSIAINQDLPLIPGNTALSLHHSFYMLNINLKEGRDLVIRDSCGTSDPYVKFKVGNKVVYKSKTVYKNLNPRWDELFTVPLEDVTKPIGVKVFDYDRAWNDDPMGGADLDLTSLEVNKEVEIKLQLSEKGKEEYMGYLILTCKLVPKSDEEREQPKEITPIKTQSSTKETKTCILESSFFRRSVRSTDAAAKKMKSQSWNGLVNVVLVEGSKLVPMDDNGYSDPYVKFRLGTEKYRSKFKSKTLSPRWLEQFDLWLYEDQASLLEITVYDHDTRGKDDFMGRAVIDLSQLEKDRTHTIEQRLEDGAGIIKLLLTISGTYGSENASDLANYTPSPVAKDKIVQRYSAFSSFGSLSDVGQLEVKVFRAHGLQSADFGGLSDPFCVLELVNDRVQTQTEYKTLNPEWAKVFTFQVKDIHSVLEVTVYDEDRNKKVEFLGKVAIPLLKARNGERRWYALKDRKLTRKTKGAVLLEMDFVFNHVKAAIRTINPREEKFMKADEKFKISVMKQNVGRVSELIGGFIESGKFIQSCFDWQSPPRSIVAFIVYLVIVWNFELYMLPITLLLVFMKNFVVAQIMGSFKKEAMEEDCFAEDDDDEDEDKDKTEEKKSIVERYHAIQEVCLQVQQALDMVASLGERVKNTFNWTVPWLSALAVVALLIGMIVLFYIPVRYLLLLWGINKFTKKLRKPNAISNNELLDFLSRVPSDAELLNYKELRPDVPANTVSCKKKRS